MKILVSIFIAFFALTIMSLEKSYGHSCEAALVSIDPVTAGSHSSPRIRPWTEAEFITGLAPNFARVRTMLEQRGLITRTGSGFETEALSELLTTEPGGDFVTTRARTTRLPLVRAAQIARILGIDLAEIVLPPFIRATRTRPILEFDLRSKPWTPTQYFEGILENLRLVSGELKSRGISLRVAAAGLDFRLKTFNNLLTGQGSRLDLYRAALLARYLGIDPMDLLIPTFLQPGRLAQALEASRPPADTPASLGIDWSPREFQIGIRQNLEVAKDMLIERGIISRQGPGYSYVKLAELLSLEPSGAMSFINSASRPTLVRLAQLSQILRVDLATFLIPKFVQIARSPLPQTFSGDKPWTPNEFRRGIDRNVGKLRGALRSRGVKTSKVANAIGVNEDVLSNALEAKNQLYPDLAVALAKYFRIDPMDIMTPDFLEPGRIERALAGWQPSRHR